MILKEIVEDFPDIVCCIFLPNEAELESGFIGDALILFSIIGMKGVFPGEECLKISDFESPYLPSRLCARLVHAYSNGWLLKFAAKLFHCLVAELEEFYNLVD